MKKTKTQYFPRYAFAALMVLIMLLSTVMFGALEINAADTKTDFDNLKATALAEINAIDSENSIVAGAMVKYVAQIEAIKYSEDAAKNATEYLNKTRIAINAIVADAHNEANFLNSFLCLDFLNDSNRHIGKNDY